MVKIIKRYIADSILSRLSSEVNKIIIIYGPRQIGKTTLANEIINDLGLKTLRINADEKKYNDILSSRDLTKLKSFVSGYELLFIDEAQRIENIGINLKIISDNLKELKIIVTGSSSFDLSNKVKEPLTGRTWTYNLYPLSFLELKSLYNEFELDGQLENFLVFGGYPEVFVTENIADRQKLLEEISVSYLYKDILEIESIKYSNKIKDLLKLLSFQIGNEVSINELGASLELSNETVEKYIDLLEKSFVVFRLSGFSRNLRKEVSKRDKIYFYDLGIRNVIIDNLKSLSDRNDAGQLFENFVIAERMKKIKYQETLASTYFWRVYTGSEIDYIEEKNGSLYAYEIKYGKNKSKHPASFLKTYEKSEFRLINRNNYLDFIA